MKNTKHMINIVAVIIIVVAAFFVFAGRGGASSVPQYRVLMTSTPAEMETVLNTEAKQGWRLHSTAAMGAVVLVKE